MKKKNLIFLLWECENFMYEIMGEKSRHAKRFTKTIHLYINKHITGKQVKLRFAQLMEYFSTVSQYKNKYIELIQQFDNYVLE